MERLGVPTATITTDVFDRTARAMAKMMGVPAYVYGMARHPLVTLTPEELQDRARELVDHVKGILLESKP